jgi:hypothetical protein
VSHRLAFLWKLKADRRAEQMAEFSVSMDRELERELRNAGLTAWRRPHAIAALTGGLISAIGLKALRAVTERDLLARFEERYWQRLRSEGRDFPRAALAAEIGEARQIYLEHIQGSGGALAGTAGLCTAILLHHHSTLLPHGGCDPYDGPLRSISDTAAARAAQAYRYVHFHLN